MYKNISASVQVVTTFVMGLILMAPQVAHAYSGSFYRGDGVAEMIIGFGLMMLGIMVGLAIMFIVVIQLAGLYQRYPYKGNMVILTAAALAACKGVYELGSYVWNLI